MIFQHHRFQIWNSNQHPYKHDPSEFLYVNPSMPGVTNMEDALNWIIAVLYPNALDAVATPAALPTVGNTINDYRVVTDDGDGKAASYRWEQREGDVAPQWYKVYDMDWGEDSILSNFLNQTQDVYVYRHGIDQLDETGAVIVGTYAGQTIYGGQSAGTNLTLNANAGDGTGAQTGYVQVDSNFRPVVHNTYDLATNTERFKDGYFQGSITVGNLVVTSGSITDSSGAISFGDENLSTTGDITGAIITANTNFVTGTLTLDAGSITDTSGSISFGDENLSTTGTINGASGSGFGTLTLANGSITDSSGAISFGDENLSTTGTLGAGVTTVTQLNVDNLRLDGNTLSSTDLNGNIVVSANGTGIIDIQSPLQTLGITATGTVGVTGQLNADNLRLDGNVISATNVDGGITLTPNGTGTVTVSSNLLADADNANDLGLAGTRWKDLYLSGDISDGTNQILMSELLSLRNLLFQDAGRTTAVVDGASLFWNAASGTWLASVPDSEITHADISGLTTGDAGHTQFAMLAGRSGGQTLSGGTAASENLTLSSTSNVTKGNIVVQDHLIPGSDGDRNLGSVSAQFDDLYMTGELIGGRLQNFTTGTLPASSATRVGRAVWTTDTGQIYVDTGSVFKRVTVNKHLSDTVWNGTDTTKDVDVSASVADARNCIWALHDNSNDFERVYTVIKATSATNVRIEVSPALPAGSYRLIGIE